MQGMFSGHLQQAAAMTPKATHGTDRIRWPEACAKQTNRVKILDPLAIRNVAFASGNALQGMSVDQTHLEAALLQNLIQRYPVNAGGLHRYGANPAHVKPVGQRLQITGEACKHTRSLLISVRRQGNVNLLCPYVNARRIRLQHRRSANCLHAWSGHDHPPLMPKNAARGANPCSLLI